MMNSLKCRLLAAMSNKEAGLITETIAVLEKKY
jgi:hypothetical protein